MKRKDEDEANYRHQKFFSREEVSLSFSGSCINESCTQRRRSLCLHKQDFFYKRCLEIDAFEVS